MDTNPLSQHNRRSEEKETPEQNSPRRVSLVVIVVTALILDKWTQQSIPILKWDLVILNASSLFRRNALRGRPFTIPGRGRLRHLLVLRLFIDLAVLLVPLRRFGALPQELDVAGVDFQTDALNALAIGVLFAA